MWGPWVFGCGGRSGARDGPYGGGSGGGGPISTLWVGDLPGECTNDDLAAGFSICGMVLHAAVSRSVAKSGARSGFVMFSTAAEAEDALATAQVGMVTVGGTPVTCKWAKNNSFATTGAPRAAAASPAAVAAPAAGAPKGVRVPPPIRPKKGEDRGRSPQHLEV